MKVSILILTMNRLELTKKVIAKNLDNCGHDHYELLICDQGSGPEMTEYLKSLNPKYLRLNKNNEGIARSLNQLILRASGDYFFWMPIDIALPGDWLFAMHTHAWEIDRTGIIGFEGQDLVLPELEIKGKIGVYTIRSDYPYKNLEGEQIFGSIFFTRELVNKIGGFCEDYHPYGLEDSDFCFRAMLAGFYCYYIPGLKSEHLGINSEDKPEYRNAKDFCYYSNLTLHNWRFQNYNQIGYYEKLPVMR